MKRLHDKVNVIPLIAKADTLTPEECQLFKKQVRVCPCYFILEVIALCTSKDVIVSFLDHEGDPGTQNQDLRVSRHRRR